MYTTWLDDDAPKEFSISGRQFEESCWYQRDDNLVIYYCVGQKAIWFTCECTGFSSSHQKLNQISGKFRQIMPVDAAFVIKSFERGQR